MHVEDYCENGGREEQYFDGYADPQVHRVMLSDAPRMAFYHERLSHSPLVAGRVVVDVGSGSGVLSCWAAQGGAALVLSVEASSLARLQPATFERNHVADRVEVLHTTIEDLVEAGVESFLEQHPKVAELGGISLVVSEWMGFYLLHECMLPSVLRARDFFNAVNASLDVKAEPVTMLPSTASISVAPIQLGPLQQRVEEFWTNVDGLDLSAMATLEYFNLLQSSPLVEVFPSTCLAHPGQKVWSSSLQTLTVEECQDISTEAQFIFTGKKAVSVDGFVVWFDVEFEGRRLDTSPTAPPTHWKQTAVLLPEEVRDEKLVIVEQGDQLGICLRFHAEDLGLRSYTMDLELI